MKRVLTITLLVALLVALTANVAAAHKGGPKHGNTYAKNYFPTEYFRVCHPDGSKYFGKVQAAKRCNKGWTGYAKQFKKGRAYYRVGVHYDWKSGSGEVFSRTKQYYCQFHKYDDPNSKRPRFQCQVTNEKTNKRYWQRFDRYAPFPTPPEDRVAPETEIISGPRNDSVVLPGQTVTFRFRANEPGVTFQCRAWGRKDSYDLPHEPPYGPPKPPWGSCNNPYSGGQYHVYTPSNEYYQHFHVRAIDKAGNVENWPAQAYFHVRHY